MEKYKQAKEDLLWLCVIILLLQLAWVVLPVGRDDTDGESRSGLNPRTDACTGCPGDAISVTHYCGGIT